MSTKSKDESKSIFKAAYLPKSVASVLRFIQAGVSKDAARTRLTVINVDSKNVVGCNGFQAHFAEVPQNMQFDENNIALRTNIPAGGGVVAYVNDEVDYPDVYSVLPKREPDVITYANPTLLVNALRHFEPGKPVAIAMHRHRYNDDEPDNTSELVHIEISGAIKGSGGARGYAIIMSMMPPSAETQLFKRPDVPDKQVASEA